jgi:SAM-dependent methyltransferase
MDSKMASVSPCPVCGSLETDVYLAGENKVPQVSAMGSSRTDHSSGTINRCSVCGHAFRIMRPSASELAALYRDMESDVYEPETAQRTKTATLHFGRVKRRVHHRAPLLLDVGCGSGLLLDLALRSGWDVVGVEPSTRFFLAAQKRLDGRGQLFNATLQESDLTAGSFDVVTAWDVIEHVNDPAGFVDLCARLLRPGGFLFMKAPQIDSLQARLLGARWPVLLPEHLHYFTRASLQICGDRSGLLLVQFSRQPAYFSLGYLLYRLSQHRVTGAHLLNSIMSHSRVSGVTIPLRLGELCVVWKKQPHGESKRD